jgi:nucleoside permease NupC
MLIVKDYTLYPSKQYLTSKIRQVLEYSSEGNDFSFMQLRDHDDNETDVKDLVDTIKTLIGIFNSMIIIIRMMTMIVIMAALQDPPYRF